MKIIFNPVISDAAWAIGESLRPKQFDIEILSQDADQRARQLAEADFLMGFLRGMPLGPDDYPQLKKVKLIADDEQTPDWDQWDGYPAERDRFFTHIVEREIDNVVILSGDVHVSLVLEVHRDPFDPGDVPLAVEFVTPSMTSQNLDDKMGWARRDEQSLVSAADLSQALAHASRHGRTGRSSAASGRQRLPGSLLRVACTKASGRSWTRECLVESRSGVDGSEAVQTSRARGLIQSSCRPHLMRGAFDPERLAGATA